MYVRFQLTPKYSHRLIVPVNLPNMLWLALPFDVGTLGKPSYANNDRISAARIFLSEALRNACCMYGVYVAHLSHNGWIVVYNNQQRLRDTCVREKLASV